MGIRLQGVGQEQGLPLGIDSKYVLIKAIENYKKGLFLEFYNNLE